MVSKSKGIFEDAIIFINDEQVEKLYNEEDSLDETSATFELNIMRNKIEKILDFCKSQGRLRLC